MKNDKTILILLILAGVVVKFVNVGFTNCISTNGLFFVSLAENMLNGGYDSAYIAYIPPLYPLLITISNFLVNNLEVSGQIISAISGVGIILILYRLGKEMFDSRIGILMAVFGIISPIFNTYSSRVMDDMPYALFYTCAVYAGWKFLKKQDYKSGIWFAVFAALSYYIRPEGLGIIIIVSGWFVFTISWKLSNILKHASLIIAINLFFIVCAIPQIYLIYKTTGEFSFSGKTSYVLRDIDKFDSTKSILKKDTMPDSRIYEDSERVAYENQGRFLGIIINHPKLIIKKLIYNLKGYLSRIPRAIGYLITIPLCFGIVYRKEVKYRKKEELFLLSIIVFNIIALSLFKEKYRHLISAAPLLYIWCAIGIYEIIRLIKNVKHRLLFNVKEDMIMPVILSVCVISVLPQTFSNISNYGYTWRKGPEKIAGKWVSENIPEDAVIMSWDAVKVLHYSNIKPRFLLKNSDNYEYVMDMAREIDADYIILNSHESRRAKKSIIEFLRQVKNKDLTLCCKTEYSHQSDNIQIYRFIKT